MGIVFANEQTIHMMRALGSFDEHDLFEMPLNVEVDLKVADHTDLSVFISDAIYIAPCIYEAFRAHWHKILSARPTKDVRNKNFSDWMVCGTSVLKHEYPYDIAYNAVKLENHFFHKLAYTEPKILAALSCETIDVNQGYTRCSTMVLNNRTVITEDCGLAKTYEVCGYDVLLIEKGFVTLQGFNYGFFGGSGGVIEDALVLNGALRHHPNGVAITNFVHRHGLRIVELHTGPLVDCGSILYFS